MLPKLYIKNYLNTIGFFLLITPKFKKEKKLRQEW
jgi:hypothetical protein